MTFQDETLRHLEKALRKQGETTEKMVEILQESHLTQVELVKVLKDIKRVLSVKDTTQIETLEVLKQIRDALVKTP